VDDGRPQADLVCGFNERRELLTGRGHGLLDEDVSAGTETLYRHVGVGRNGRADVDPVDRFLGEEVFEVGVRRDTPLCCPLSGYGLLDIDDCGQS
jgi:hypothetical protein